MDIQTTGSRHRKLSLILAVVMLLSIFLSQTVSAGAAEESVYCKQIGSGKCTLASATMMMRQKAKNEGNAKWTSITQESIMSTAWINGAGLRHSFTYEGISVSYADFNTSTSKKAQVLAILKNHPEGFEIYERALPHAIFLTRYDEATDTFYCADPAYEAGERTLAASYLRRVSSASTPAEVQKDILNGLDSYWYVSKYNATASSAYDQDTLKEETQKEQNQNTSNNSSSNAGSDSGKKDDPATTPSTDQNGGSDNAADSEQPADNQNEPADDVTEPDTPAEPDKGTVDGVVSDDEQNDDVDGDIIVVDNASSNNDQIDGYTVKFDSVYNFSDVYFKDVKAGAWYIKYITSAYEMGLMKGITEKEFGVDGNVTIVQAVTMAARISSIYEGYSGKTVDFTAKKGEMWYMPYANYCYENGIINTKYYTLAQTDGDRDATRAEFAEILAGSLPEKALPAVNEIPEGSIVDVDADVSSGKAVYMLYRSGVLAGDPDGLFRPEDTIRRSEVAAVVSRMADSELRIVK